MPLTEEKYVLHLSLDPSDPGEWKKEIWPITCDRCCIPFETYEEIIPQKFMCGCTAQYCINCDRLCKNRIKNHIHNEYSKVKSVKEMENEKL